ncbi:hypothetical protein DM02DRAFT_533973 [Periconia macrospinosa]|uniref:Cyclase n=1 Tax=Periconia macrospinosa TaxID=97972 RepID=A0A2V1DGC5_9PLEO|nr:hypothetical protein DM02DRAFT_533973 [Periconia macrospinosa]
MLSVILIPALLAAEVFAVAFPNEGARLKSRQFDNRDPYKNWPSYGDLPLDASYPMKAAWGVWGADDVNGALNHITDETRRQAASEIQTGEAFNLNLELSFIPYPLLPERRPLVHTFQPGAGYTDDVITLNTQMSTQYDGLRHFAYSVNGNSSTYQYYNDLIPDYDHVIGHNYTSVLGIQQAAEKAIVARGVLLDYKAWMDDQNRTFDPFTELLVPSADLQKVAEWQGLPSNFSRPGDILIVRFGWTAAFSKLNEAQKQELVLGPGTYIGVKADDASAEWLWNQKLALVGSDNPGFESLPLTVTDHHVGWGQSILEFIDCEKLAPALHAKGRSTFFLTIQPINKIGGIASPPNAMAVI